MGNTQQDIRKGSNPSPIPNPIPDPIPNPNPNPNPNTNPNQDIRKAFEDYQRTGFGPWPWPSDAHAFARDEPRFALYADGTREERPLGTDGVCATKGQ